MAKTTLSELCASGDGSIQTGPFGSQLHAEEYSATGVPVVMPQDLGENTISTAQIARVPEGVAARLARHRLAVGDIIFSRRGDVTRRALVRESNVNWLCGTGCLRVRPGAAVDSRFLSYLLGTSDAKEWLLGNAVGTNMLNLNTTILGRLPLAVPSLPEQQAIAEVLGALDDKIAANTALAAITDELVRAEYLALDGEQVRVGDVAESPRSGVDPSAVESHELYVGLEHVGRRRMWLEDAGRASEVTSTKSRFEAGDVLFGKLRPYFHKVVSAPVSGICSTDILVVRARKDHESSVLMAALTSDAVIEAVVAASEGTRMPRTNWKDLSLVEITWPTPSQLNTFAARLDAVREATIAALTENRTLAATRDALLPQLMSGKLRVRDAEAAASEAGA